MQLAKASKAAKQKKKKQKHENETILIQLLMQSHSLGLPLVASGGGSNSGLITAALSDIGGFTSQNDGPEKTRKGCKVIRIAIDLL